MPSILESHPGTRKVKTILIHIGVDYSDSHWKRGTVPLGSADTPAYLRSSNILLFGGFGATMLDKPLGLTPARAIGKVARMTLRKCLRLIIRSTQ